MTRSDRIRTDESGVVHARSRDGEEVRLAGMGRMHFFRLTGATPEEATEEQVDRFFELRAQEERSGRRATEVLRNESATDMVTRELGIFNLPQVLGRDDAVDAAGAPPAAAALPPTMTPPAPSPPTGPSAGTAPQRPDPSAPPQTASGGLPPPPRYTPTAAPAAPAQQQPSPTGAGQGPEAAPQSRFLRQDGAALYLQSPDGSEQRVTQYIRAHFLRMIERDITDATDQDIEMWFKLQGSLEAGATLQEARSRSLLTEALQAAGKLNRADLEVLQQSINAWMDARRDDAAD